jgi:hypothetical protein
LTIHTPGLFTQLIECINGVKMSRTPGSGWGAGPTLWQVCPFCGKKKAFYHPINYDELRHYKPFKCTACKERFDSDKLLKTQYPTA